jgi:hypothetical protein
LPTISKFVERAIFDQLTDFFNFHFHALLSALKKFRKGFGCQTEWDPKFNPVAHLYTLFQKSYK